MSPYRFAAPLVLTVVVVACGGQVGGAGISGGDQNDGKPVPAGSAVDAGGSEQADAGCDGYWLTGCDSNGRIGPVGCCHAGSNCAATGGYCDNGDGTCDPMPCGTKDVDAGVSDAGCSASISAESYDQSCSGDSDCTAVYEGSLCGECFCPNAPINKNALSTYQNDVSALGGDKGNACACPLIEVPACINGTCSMKPH